MLAKMAEWAAWYSGEPTRIIDVYAGQGAAAVQSPVPWWRFWSRARSHYDGMQRAQLHVPIASDLAGVSGALLFGEAPRIRMPSARELPDSEPDVDPETGEAKPPPETPEEKSEARLLEIIDRSDLNARLVEAAETAAAIGGVYIYPAWDKDILDVPFMAVAQADNAVPEFRHGYLTAVTFFRTVVADGNRIVRHLERHEVQGEGAQRRGHVLHGMYQGSSTALGERIPLNRELVGNVDDDIVLPEGMGLDVRYIPNIRPNRLFRASGLGVADIQGSETLLDALDETYASWMRDVRLSKARILVPREYLRADPGSGQPAFDVDQEIYVGMDMEPGMSQDARAMLAHQFSIRHEEHKATADDIIAHIVSNAGYTPSAAQRVEGGAGAALRINERKTLLTLKRKSAWWRSALADVLYGIQLIDGAEFGGTTKAIRPAVLTADSIIDSPLELAQTALALKTAESASIETRVRIVNPDWSAAEIMAEVRRIEDGIQAAKPAPPVIGADGQFGKPTEDPAGTANKPTTDQTKGVSGNPAGAPPAEPTSPPQAR